MFALINSSDVFLLLRARQAGLGDTGVIGLYCLYNVVYAAAAYSAGQLADRIGLKPVLVGGLVVFAGVYGGMSVAALGASVGAGLLWAGPVVVFGLAGSVALGVAGYLAQNRLSPCGRQT